MTNEEATIANIRAQLASRGWSRVEEYIDPDTSKKDNCHLELYNDDGERKGWGMFPRLYCWTEAYEAITGQSWVNSIVRTNSPAP